MKMTLKQINDEIRTEQILAAFDIRPNFSNKILCPVHKETEPSALINEHYLFCFGCKRSFTNFDLAEILLSAKKGKEVTRKQVFNWFERVKLPEASKEDYKEHKYVGPVPIEFIDYWQGCMTDYSYEVLEKERKITRKTAEQYKIGWRPDYGAWAIPFWRGELGHSEADIIQFRMQSGKPKYMGMSGHNRGSIMNAHLLQVAQPYLVVLFHAFDPILALQEGTLAVGTNGSFPFRAEDKERVKGLFKLQKNIFVVPDNNPDEFKSAYKLVEWIGGTVKFFPYETPHNTDYIDYRRMGYLPMDFRQTVLELDFPYYIVENIVSLLSCGDPENLARYHAWIGTQIYPPDRLVSELERYGPLHYSKEQWNTMLSILRQSQDRNNFFTQVGQVSKLALEYTGSW